MFVVKFYTPTVIYAHKGPPSDRNGIRPEEAQAHLQDRRPGAFRDRAGVRGGHGADGRGPRGVARRSGDGGGLRPPGLRRREDGRRPRRHGRHHDGGLGMRHVHHVDNQHADAGCEPRVHPVHRGQRAQARGRGHVVRNPVRRPSGPLPSASEPDPGGRAGALRMGHRGAGVLLPGAGVQVRGGASDGIGRDAARRRWR